MVNDVWDATVDGGKFEVGVERTGARSGKLRVVVASTREVLLVQDVGLAYGAMFGPDVDDVMEWQNAAMPVIDAWIAEHPA